jgi:hypothetical protein
MRMRYPWPAPLYHIFPHYLKKRQDFRRKKKVIENMFVLVDFLLGISPASEY